MIKKETRPNGDIVHLLEMDEDAVTALAGIPAGVNILLVVTRNEEGQLVMHVVTPGTEGQVLTMGADNAFDWADLPE